jgi:plastocyanin
VNIRPVVLGAAMSLIFVVGCGGGGTGTGASPAGATPAAGADAVEVTIADFAFTPAEATAAVGGAVHWTNNDSAPHSVSWADEEPESNDLDNGDDYERTFDGAGTYEYACGIHPTMTGSVTVTQ